MATNLKTRVEKLELASNPENPSPWQRVLAATFGGSPLDYMVDGREVTLEGLICAANEPDTSDGNRAE
jgi:hypothetical protein